MPILHPTCEQLKKEYDSLYLERKKILSVFQGEIQKRDFLYTRELKKKILERMMNLKESIITSDKIFLAELNKEQTFQKLTSMVKSQVLSGTMPEYGEGYKEIEEIFSSIESHFSFNNLCYKHFVEGLHQWFEDKKEKAARVVNAENSSRSFRSSLSYFMDITCLIHSVFLNKFLQPNTILRIKTDLPYELDNGFGWFLKQGTIYLSKVGSRAGLGMKGGTLNIGKAGRYLGRSVTGGIIKAREVKGQVGVLMKGGIITVQKSGNNAMESMRGGVAILNGVGETLADYMSTEGGTILVENFKNSSSLAKGAIKSSIFHYNPSTRSYSSLEEKRSFWGKKYQSAHVIKTQEDLKEFFQQQHGLRIIKELHKITNPTQDMDKVILVLYQTPKDNIGEGMKGGVLILEDQKISKEEVKKRLSPQREGGLIMMRVSDPDDLGKTTLEVVE